MIIIFFTFSRDEHSTKHSMATVLSWIMSFLQSATLRRTNHHIVSKPTTTDLNTATLEEKNEDLSMKQIEDDYKASAGIIWMTGRNAPISADTPGGDLPFLFEQANVVSTLIKNRHQL